MKKISILACCFFALSMPAMDKKNELLARMRSHIKQLDRDTVSVALLGGGVVVSRIFAQVCDGQEYCFAARALPLVPGLTMVTINMVREFCND